VKGVTQEQAVMDLNEYIWDLSDDAFSKSPENQKKTLDNILLAVQDMLGEEAYIGAVNHLTSILDKMESEGQDWIIDPEAQTHIVMKIEDIVSYLLTLI
jgi:hypothetical protein